MKLLSICIPNYNRIDKLKRLICEIAKQITEYALIEQVQVCVSDDCSDENPYQLLKEIKKMYPKIEILFERNTQNRGMDFNFLNSVLMASSEYCWIIGNDDLPTKEGIVKAISILKAQEPIDILLTPLNSHSEDGKYKETVYPLIEDRKRVFDTTIQQQYSEWILSVKHNCGIFGYLSNVIFRRSKWIQYKEQFRDKMDSIFIQMYMNIQTLKSGAVLLYEPIKIIDHYADEKVNESIDRICRILIGLDGVVEYFFEGIEKEYLKRVIVDEYISGKVWELPDKNLYKKKINKIISPKNQIYKKYFISVKERQSFYKNKQFIIYGTGKYGSQVYDAVRKSEGTIIGMADSDILKKGKYFERFAIMSVCEMAKMYTEQKAYILVANHSHLEEMVQTLLEKNMDRIAIIS